MGGTSGAGGSEASSSAGRGGTNSGGAQPAPQCSVDADCEDGDPSDGEETCEVAVCRLGNAPPRVVSIAPGDGATDAEPDTVVTITFSEPLDPESVTPDKLSVFEGDVPISGSFELVSARDALRFTPAAALSLWTEYRVELERTIADRDGATMLEPFSSSFRVRDGSWSVKTLAQNTSVRLPGALAVTPEGLLLATWLADEGDKCFAAGSWLLRGRAEPSWLFKSPALEGPCADLSVSVASDGSAVASWIRSGQDYTQTFIGGNWASSERMNRKRYGSRAETSRAFCHGSSMSTFTRVVLDDTGEPSISVDVGAMSGSWHPTALAFATASEGSVEGAFDASGSGFAAWSESSSGAQIAALRYDGVKRAWDAAPTTIPGSKQSTTKEAHRRGTPGVVTTPGGDALVLWVEELATRRWLKSSRYTLNVGWQSAPTTVFSDPSLEPFSEPPALVYDGQTFVAAWTAHHDGDYAVYTARYDLADGMWTVEPTHATALGQSALVMPRLGADARGNLLLVWALAGSPSKLAYRRYQASGQKWADIQLVPEVELANLTTETANVLPFALSANSVGGLLFRTKEGSGETLKLAQFF